MANRTNRPLRRSRSDEAFTFDCFKSSTADILILFSSYPDVVCCCCCINLVFEQSLIRYNFVAMSSSFLWNSYYSLDNQFYLLFHTHAYRKRNKFRYPKLTLLKQECYKSSTNIPVNGNKSPEFVCISIIKSCINFSLNFFLWFIKQFMKPAGCREGLSRVEQLKISQQGWFCITHICGSMKSR